MSKEFIRYLKICKELGGFYKKTTDDYWAKITEYGIQVVENVKGTMISMLDMDMNKPMVCFNWKIFFQGKWVYISENSIIISIYSTVYCKQKGEKSYIINELDGYRYYDRTDEILIFIKEKDVAGSLWKALSLSSKRIYEIEGNDLKILRNVNCIQTDKLWSLRTYRIYLIKNGEIDSTYYMFLHSLVSEEGFQVNLDRKTGQWGLFYISKGEIRLIETYDECTHKDGCCCKAYPQSYIVQKDGQTMLLEVEQKKIKHSIIKIGITD